MIIRPHLLYVYPWMPYPRRVIIYLREKRIPSRLVTIVRVSDPQHGDTAAPGFPPRPKGSLPILAIPNELLCPNATTRPSSPAAEDANGYEHVSQSLAIVAYLEGLCTAGAYGFPQSRPMRPLAAADPLTRARYEESLRLADELLPTWNPVRLFGTGLGPLKLPSAAYESLRWTHRQLAAVEAQLSRSGQYWESLKDEETAVTIADVVLYQFCEFTKEVYGVDVTTGGIDKEKDVYGRDAVKGYPNLRAFYEAFGERGSAQLYEEKGEVATQRVKEGGRTWWEGCGLDESA
ncbi:hypothetical protein NA57DRAFT_79382 [Rhizodiscina lignyota]|uniref:GST N-terminal domain-containing protein n=1 Tax=Rhizodiscina lignyota TaxID=1504668 RepID=A0A9P4I7Z9_9PEZI|nr:hypothetical protein NA57DRAFT_79382 [Rhizodiscina lignyota]